MNRLYFFVEPANFEKMNEKRKRLTLLFGALIFSAAVAWAVAFQKFHQPESIFSAIVWFGISFVVVWNVLKVIATLHAVMTRGGRVLNDLPNEEEAARRRRSAAEMLKERRKGETPKT